MTRGHRGALTLRCRALSSPSPCRFIPALSKTTGHAHQFVAGLSGDLMHISDPLPGCTHDAKGIHETGVADILGPDNGIGDKDMHPSSAAAC
jgi:hypothetical protein